MLASREGRTDVVEVLIKYGADVDARNEVRGWLCVHMYMYMCPRTVRVQVILRRFICTCTKY